MTIVGSAADLRRLRRHATCLALVLLAMPGFLSPAQAEGVPPHLASLAAQLYRDNAKVLEDPQQDPEHAEAARRALDMLRRAGIRHWARTPVQVPGAAEAVATALGFDLASEADRAELDRFLALDSEAAAAAIAERIQAAGGDEAAINDAVTAVAAAFMPAESLATQHVIELDRGETVELEWNPQSGEFTIEAADDGSGGDKPFNSVLLGETAFAADPETGGMTTTIAPAETPARTYTKRDFERIRASIFGEWRDQDDAIWTIAPVGDDTGLGDIQRSPAAIDAEIEALEAQIDEIQKAKEFVWHDPTTGEIIRQQRFRRLELPWEFVGEEALVPNAEQEVAERREQIAALEAEKSGTSLPPVQQYDPAGFGSAQKSAGAVPV
ncbi:MAG: hypothetical protein WD715_03945, partial [Dongiaceae bacterium]